MSWLSDLFGGDDVAKAYNKAASDQKYYAGKAQYQQQKALSAIKPAFDTAKKSLVNARTVSLDRAQQQGQEAQAGANQALAARGLYNSTVLDNARSGISSSVTENLARIDAQYADLLGQLDIQRGGAIAGIRGNMANTNLAIGQNAASLYANEAQALQQAQASGFDFLGNLLGIGGMFAGYGLFSGGGESQPSSSNYGMLFK